MQCRPVGGKRNRDNPDFLQLDFLVFGTGINIAFKSRFFLFGVSQIHRGNH